MAAIIMIIEAIILTRLDCINHTNLLLEVMPLFVKLYGGKPIKLYSTFIVLWRFILLNIHKVKTWNEVKFILKMAQISAEPKHH